jgi:hypothetical protein
VPAETPEPDAWQGVSQEDWQQQQEVLQQQQELLQQLQPVAEYLQQVPGPEQFQQPSEIDLFADNATDQIRQLIRDETAPYNEVMQQRRLEELEASAHDMIADYQSEKGELLQPKYEEGQQGLDPNTLILEVAKSYSPTMVQQYGEGIRADEEAIAAAYEDVKQLFDGLTAAHEARQQNQLAALSGAPREPGASGIAAQPAITTQPGGWDSFKARWELS